MPEPLLELDYLDYDGSRVTKVRRPVIAETPWVLYVDRHELLTFMCSPVRLHCLALGFLVSEGLIDGLEDVYQLKVYLDQDRVWMVYPDAGVNELLPIPACEEAVGAIDVRLRRPVPNQSPRRVLTSGCGGGITFDDLHDDRPALSSSLRVSAKQITGLMRELDYHATLYRQSRGVHTSALAEGNRLLVLAEDVGRHNTLDKIRGECLLDGIVTQDRILLTSGRISSEMIGKARKMEVPVVVSRTSPTATSVRLAQQWGMTLIGYARAPKFRVYTGAERVDWE
ncbi:MAG: formate dehydrogenase accessory sulfurtransferase FdhD [Herpetosiphonaceae bacterium]|nr:formate dehydrogenase accessory sulfurtransferase FdhD [Herpetosiphonaceae bacterium]